MSKLITIFILAISLVLSQGRCYGKSSALKKNKVKARTTAAAPAAVFSAPRSISAAGITFTWRTDGKILMGTLSAPSGGWIAVGFGGNTMATVGKVVIGSVTGRVAQVEIEAITGRRHAKTSGAIIEATGTEDAKQTTIDFKATLADLGLAGKVGTTFPITLARNSETKDTAAYHNGDRGSVNITL